MKRSMLLLFSFTLPCQILFGQILDLDNAEFSPKHHSNCHESCQLGTAAFGVTSPTFWYTINTLSYPNAVPLSLNRNLGFSQGDIKLKPNGLKIYEKGNYSVSFSAILQNNEIEGAALIPVFVALDGSFSQTSIGGVVTLPTGQLNTVYGTGILENIEEGTRLTLVATNGGSPNPQPITVISWSISVFKIPCKSGHH